MDTEGEDFKGVTDGEGKKEERVEGRREGKKKRWREEEEVKGKEEEEEGGRGRQGEERTEEDINKNIWRYSIKSDEYYGE